MSLSNADKKMCKLVKAVVADPNSNRAWGALAQESQSVADSLRDLLVATGRMTLAE